MGVASVAILAGLVSIIWQAKNASGGGGGTAYFTIDDGQTVFTDKITRMAPFQKDGKEAVRAHVFMCGGKQVVGYMERYTPDALQALEEAKASRGSGKPPPNVAKLASMGTSGLELKKPGEAKWVSGADGARVGKIRGFRCADGSTPNEVDPQ
jgi:hypothetical protein